MSTEFTADDLWERMGIAARLLNAHDKTHPDCPTYPRDLITQVKHAHNGDLIADDHNGELVQLSPGMGAVLRGLYLNNPLLAGDAA